MKRNLVTCLFLLLTIFFATGCPTAKPTKEPTNGNEPDAKEASDVSPAVVSDVATEQAPIGDLTIEYKDATYPFRFKIPTGWQYKEKYENSVVMALGPVDAQGHYPNVNVIVTKADPNILNMPQGNFETVMKKQIPSYNLITFETTKLGKHDVLHTKSTFTPAQDLSMTQEQYMFNVGVFAYIITCSQISAHYQDSEKTFKSILASFEFE